jgi:hypothetical protein
MNANMDYARITAKTEELASIRLSGNVAETGLTLETQHEFLL